MPYDLQERFHLFEDSKELWKEKAPNLQLLANTGFS